MTLSAIVVGIVALLALMFLSIPVAGILMGLAVIGGVAVVGPNLFMSLGDVAWTAQNSYTMMAIPLFVMMGELLLRSGMADDMFGSLGWLLRRLPGGLVQANIVACALFSATSGSSVATAATVGTVALPSLEKQKYDKRASLGSLAAGGTLGILIPPSIALLIYGSMTNISIGQLFIAGIVPGIGLTLAFMVWAAIGTPKTYVALEPDTRTGMAGGGPRLRSLIPPITVFVVVMGSIYGGFATATESACLGIFVIWLFGLWQKRMGWKTWQLAFQHTAGVVGLIMLLMVAAMLLNTTLNLLNIPQFLTKSVLSTSISAGVFIFSAVVLYFVLGMFIDVLTMQITTIPIIYPIAHQLGIDGLWLGIFIVLMSEIALITPPVGVNLFIIQGIRSDGGRITDVLLGSLPYVVIMLAFVGMLWIFPEIVTWLPEKLYQ